MLIYSKPLLNNTINWQLQSIKSLQDHMYCINDIMLVDCVNPFLGDLSV